MSDEPGKGGGQNQFLDTARKLSEKIVENNKFLDTLSNKQEIDNRDVILAIATLNNNLANYQQLPYLFNTLHIKDASYD